MSYAENIEDAPCVRCERDVHLHDDPPSVCGDVICPDCPPCECVVCNAIMALHELPDLVQGTPAWHDQRRGLVTASVVGQLLTSTLRVASNDVSRGLTALLVAERITGWTDPTWMNADMERGVMDEPIARDLYAKHCTDEPVTEAGFMVLEGQGFRLGFSPDGLVGADGLIEVKSRRQKKQLTTVLSGKVPTENMAQIQCGLLVSGRKWLDYISYSGGMHLWVTRVYPDPDWFTAITGAAVAFEQNAARMTSDYLTAVDGLPMTERDYLEVI